jgi:hypothetical protein
MQRKCQLCSRLFSRLKTLFIRLVGKQAYCQKLHATTFEDSARRVPHISSKCPNCACEPYRVSHFSPKAVAGNETLVRFFFHPMHADKDGNCKPNFFSHAETHGCSAQREELATRDEIYTFVTNFLGGKDTTAWLGYVAANVEHIRGIKMKEGDRAYCVYDTALPLNAAHAEVFEARAIEEADAIEHRAQLFSVFQKGIVTKCETYRNGETWNRLPAELQSRTPKAREEIAARLERAAKAQADKRAKSAPKEKRKRPK